MIPGTKVPPPYIKISNSKRNKHISDTQTTVEVHVTYTFKRENTLVDYLKLNPEYPKIFED
jgi:hypothetical protein